MSTTDLQKSTEKLPPATDPELVDEKHDVEKHGGAGNAAIHAETQDIFEDDSGVDPVYQAKARILNDAFQEIGMGRYQVRLPEPGRFAIGAASPVQARCRGARRE